MYTILEGLVRNVIHEEKDIARKESPRGKDARCYSHAAMHLGSSAFEMLRDLSAVFFQFNICITTICIIKYQFAYRLWIKCMRYGYEMQKGEENHRELAAVRGVSIFGKRSIFIGTFYGRFLIKVR